MFDSIFYWLGTEFRDGLYISSLQIGGLLCSYADICAVALLLRSMDVISGRPPSKFRYGILIVFAILTPTLLLPQKSTSFFIAQFIILAPPYLVLMYTAFTDFASVFIPYMRNKMSEFSRENQ